MTIRSGCTSLLVISLLWACANPKADKGADSAKKTGQDSVSVAPGEIHTYQDGPTQISVQYKSEEALTVTRIRKTDTTRVELSGDFQPDGILGCDNCLLINNRQTSGAIVNDSIFLLTVAGTNWRILLYGVNFNTRNVLKTNEKLPGDHLQTYLPAFVYLPQTNQLITSDRADESAEPSRPQKTVVHGYRLHKGLFEYQGQTTKTFPTDMQDNPTAMMGALRQLTFP